MLQTVHDADAGLFDATAYDESALAELIGSLQTLENAGRDTEPGEPPAVPVTRLGDLMLLGEHRLLCGDATVESDVERLMGGTLADCMWTDPPYGVDYVGKTADALTIQNDSHGDIEALVGGAFALAVAVLRPWRAISGSSRRAPRSVWWRPATGSYPTWAPPSGCRESSVRAGLAS
jgi:hypothetical protein